jgi:hypothetical protein
VGIDYSGAGIFTALPHPVHFFDFVGNVQGVDTLHAIM